MPSKRAARPIVIGHRGASGYVPEHTLTSYFIAIQQGADFAEPDLVMTKDGVLVARHENEISGTTDVAEHREFARRRTKKIIDGVELEGWFTEDFTLAELKTLRARERIPDIRPANTRFNDQFEIPTFDEVLALIAFVNEERKREFSSRSTGKSRSAANLTRSAQGAAVVSRLTGVYPETKHPSYFDGIGLSMDRPLLKSLARFGYRGPKAKVFIQSFETTNLKRLRRKTTLPMIRLIEATSLDLITPAALRDIATFANGIGPDKSLIIPRTRDNSLGRPTSLVRDAHQAGLAVHPWTFRAEEAFIPRHHDLSSELQAFIQTGIDGFFTDQPDIASRLLGSSRPAVRTHRSRS
jgi:glycerophosphoryl diester phosphodiesterase